jgi:ferredoxin-NADP reductase
MQSVIQELLNAFRGNTGWILGLVLLVVLTLYAATLWLGSVWRLYSERRQASLAQQRLWLQIELAKTQIREAGLDNGPWNGMRKFQVSKKEVECDGVVSFYLSPHDGKLPLPTFKPGQYLTFHLNIPGQAKPVIRCYSLSDSPTKQDYYRVTIKKVCPTADQPGVTPGLASCHFCDSVQIGDILDVKAPNGHFYLDMAEESPVVLISGGVGITPMLSMLNAIIDTGSRREVWFFHGARNSADHIQKVYLEKLAAEMPTLRLHNCYSRPAPADVSGRDFQHASRLTIDVLKATLPSSNYDYFLCGPGAMMKGITDGLAAWGVPKKNVHYEAFGPATPQSITPKPSASETLILSKLEVKFERSGKLCRWNPESPSLLDFAEANGIQIEAGCRAGNCGTCLVAVKSGEVDYVMAAGAGPEARSCLVCIAKPKTNLVLDA